MSDDVELYKDADLVVEMLGQGLWLETGRMCMSVGLDADKAHQIGLGLIKWADEQKEEAS